MLIKTLLPSLLAALVAALPAPDLSAEGEMELFKRDGVLNARDLELAEIHGVNLTRMYKHAVIKRDDGDHFTVWVDKGFAPTEGPEEAPGKAKRQTARLASGARFTGSTLLRDYCRNHDRKDLTSERSPTTGGVEAIYRWARDHDGYFHYGPDTGLGWRDLVVGGSNGGSNARYRAQFIESSVTLLRIGSYDVRNDADWTRKRARVYNGKWRAASYGWETCDYAGGYGRANYEVVTYSGTV
ncbi:hypothetical protein NM208_g6988 [Fusarium decemcellulare]|uniref:Uncharacterized protein n=1 Tax=Fusarium decemcellulare TaxID=57161 RepID=A0ACC1SB04_9HYPO|nr:hypothetical protein NM208_g6988 [Fusarium decemcellulare]